MRGGTVAMIVLLVVTGASLPVAAQPLAPVAPPAGSSGSGLGNTVHVVDRPPLLGAPLAVTGEALDAGLVPASTTPPTTGIGSQPRPHKRSRRAAGLGAPIASGETVNVGMSVIPAARVETPIQQVGNTGHGSSSPPVSDPVADLLGRRSGFKDFASNKLDATRTSRKFGDYFERMVGEQKDWFKGDHAFDSFVSPVTNPFLFEDPRSITEVRPIFMYQSIPGSQPDFRGGHTEFFGLQGRLAVTERLSFVLNKLGGIALSPGSGSIYSGRTGFAEIWLGPKYTFVRDEQAGRLLAGGLQFQIPAGSASVYQNTGGLSLVPYVSYAESFLRDSRAGTVNVLASGGYSFATSSQRSDYLYLSGHVDLDVLGLNRIYPLMELNYTMYTTNGAATPIGTEGRDLYNFGGQAKGQGLLSAAIGARGKITDHIQIGGAFEAPLAGPHDLLYYRFTMDMIFRY